MWLLISGFRRSTRRVLPAIAMTLGVLIAAFFTFLVTYGTKQMPAATGAPAIGQKAPDFTLVDTAGKPVALSSTLATPGTNGVLLIFYRGYW